MTDRTNLPASPAASGDNDVYPGYDGPELISGLSPADLKEFRKMDEWKEPNNAKPSDDEQFRKNIRKLTREQRRVAAGLSRSG